MNLVFTILFAIEMVIKLVAFSIKVSTGCSLVVDLKNSLNVFFALHQIYDRLLAKPFPALSLLHALVCNIPVL